MQTISIHAVAAAHEAASTIAGAGETIAVFDEKTAPLAPAIIRAGYEIAEIEFRGQGGTTSRVSIERPHFAFGGTLVPATVRWSSSDSRGGIEDAAATARLLDFAVRVAEQLNRWADRGDLPYLVGEVA